MSDKGKTKYVVGKRPPVHLTTKAREQLENAKPSILVAALARDFERLFSTSSTGEKVLFLPGLKVLKPGDMNDCLGAEDAAAAERMSSAKNSSMKSIPRDK